MNLRKKVREKNKYVGKKAVEETKKKKKKWGLQGKIRNNGLEENCGK